MSGGSRQPPTAFIDAAPHVRSAPTIAEAWLPHVLGALAPLSDPDYWEGSAEAAAHAAEQIERLMLMLVTPEESEGVSVPVGGIIVWTDNQLPEGWLLCDGSAYASADYPELAARLGTRFGSAPSGQFRVPNLTGRVAVGADPAGAVLGVSAPVGAAGGAPTHTLTVAEMPAHTHAALRMVSNAGYVAGTSSSSSSTVTTSGSAGGSQPHNNLQPYLALQYIIRAL